MPPGKVKKDFYGITEERVKKMSIVIPQSEFQERIVRFQAEMAARNLDAILVYGDEYRKENRGMYRTSGRFLNGRSV